jgi:hypothetical protein
MTSPDQPDPGRGLLRRFSLLPSSGRRNSEQRESGGLLGGLQRRFSSLPSFRRRNSEQRESGGLLGGLQRRFSSLLSAGGRGFESEPGPAERDSDRQPEPVERDDVPPQQPQRQIAEPHDIDTTLLTPAQLHELGIPPPPYQDEWRQEVERPTGDRDEKRPIEERPTGDRDEKRPIEERPTGDRDSDAQIDRYIDGLGPVQLEEFVARATIDHNHAPGRTELDTSPSYLERLTDSPTEERPTTERDSARQPEAVAERVSTPPQQPTVVHGRDQWQPVPADLDVAEISAVIAEGDERNPFRRRSIAALNLATERHAPDPLPSLSPQELAALAASRRQELRQEAASAERIAPLDLATSGDRASRIYATRQRLEAAQAKQADSPARDGGDRGGR